MTEREPLKVYELAKELGIDSISLVDQLKSLSIEVKNHMSELTDADAERARSVLKVGKVKAEDATPAKKATKTAAGKTVTRKAATAAGATSAGAATAAPVAAPAAKPAAAKTTAVRKKAAAAPASEPAGGATSSSTVIRRRTLADGATQTVTSTISQTTSAATPPVAAPVANETPVVAAPAEALPEIQAAPIEAPPAASIETLAAPVAVEALGNDGTVETVRTEVKVEGGKTTTSIIRRTETTTITQPGAPKKSLLRVIEEAKPAKSGLRTISMPEKAPVGKGGFGKTGTAVDPNDLKKPGGFKYVRVDKENLDKMAEEEAKKRARGLDGEIKPEDVNFADYRKKEMVFIPKKKKVVSGKEAKKTEITVAAAHKRVVEMGDTITVSDLANQLKVKAADVIKKLMSLGQMATMNQALDVDTATLVANEYQYEIKVVSFKEEAVLQKAEDKPEDLVHRPPVVTIMGHVDHGKTTLLDSIREANVAAGEAGGITQHIGAYTIKKDGKLITFIDTPGHEAFTMMRARGANVTDIVILVVSADDGVMPQTREALSHAKAAGVPIIVAVNKIDKPGANPEKIKQSLAELDLLAEDWGGETIYVPVSALKKTNIDKLLESILLVAEVQDLKANAKVPAEGIVLEARLEKGRGPVASLLVKRGTLRQGDIVVSGTSWGRTKAMMNHLAETVKDVGPGMAAEILGLDSIPNAGEPFNVVADERAATALIDHRRQQLREKQQKSSKASLEDLFAKVSAGDVKELRIVLKADVFGSVEAVRDSLVKLSTDKVKVKVILAAAGGITESDIMLANASGAIVLGFNVRPETKARQIAESEKVEIKTYSIIYELLDEVKGAMTGLLDKKKVETYLGRAEVRQTFSVPKAGTIAGCSVVDGKIIRNANVRLLRDSKIIYDGKLSSLKRFKDDAKEVAQGYECGMGIDGYNDIKIGDLIEAYQIDLISQEL